MAMNSSDATVWQRYSAFRCTILYNLDMITGCSVSTVMIFFLFFFFLSFLILVIKLKPDLNQSIGRDGKYALSLSARKIANLFVDRYSKVILSTAENQPSLE